MEGVEFINQFTNAETHDKRMALLSSVSLHQAPKFQSLFTKASTYKRRPGRDKALVDYDEREEMQFHAMLCRGMAIDCDGPQDAWLAAHLFKTYAQGLPGFTFRPENKCLRRVGYVMWDGTRMADEELLAQFEEIYQEAEPTAYAGERGMNEPWEDRATLTNLLAPWDFLGLV